MKKSSAKISTLVAVGGSLAALPAAALELGEAQVNSSLGQPLRASIAYALAPNEALTSNCVSLQGGLPKDAMPVVGPATIIVADGIISIAGKSALREPLVTMRVNVRCPYTAQLSREYMLFIDPVGTPTQAAAVQDVAAPQTAVTPAPVAVRRRPVSDAPIGNATRYRVQPGDTLSQIAQRIADRPVGLWTAVGAIFDANPDAFLDSDPNRLKAGSWLSIPDFGADAPLMIADSSVFPAESAAVTSAPDETSTAYPGISVDQAAAEEPVVTEPVVTEPVVTEPVVSAPVVIEPVVSIPDTELEPPVATSSSPNVPTASIQSTPVEDSSSNWLLWLAGAGIALIAGLLFFGRQVRERFGSSPIGAIAPRQQRRVSDGNTQEIEAVSEMEIALGDATPTQENVALGLDADLIIGTGLQQGSEIDVAQDFGFAATTEIDHELPEEMSSGGDLSSHTDIIPPLNVDMESILESEVLPEEEEVEVDDYDMSVIVDATKMPRPEDITEKDLEAIQVESSDGTLITDDYTVSHEVDYKVLEQDYEDEFTATQALSDEIARAAEELATRMDVECDDDEETKEMSLASVTALDVTAQLPAKNDDDISDLDDTGINEALTVNMRDSEGTAEMPVDDNTVEIPAKKDKSA